MRGDVTIVQIQYYYNVAHPAGYLMAEVGLSPGAILSLQLLSYGSDYLDCYRNHTQS